MALFKPLPIKIIQHIMDCTTLSGAYNCIFVCKALTECAVKSYYKEIFLDKDRLEDLACLQKHKLARTFLQKHGHLVNKLVIYNDKHSNIDYGGIFRDLSLVLPNLKIIDMTKSHSYKAFLEQGLNISTLSKNWKLEQILIPQLYCQAIRNKEYPRLDEFVYYIGAVNKFQESITHLVLRDIETKFWIDTKDMSYSRYIAQFQNLTHLTIFNNYLLKAFHGDDTLVLSTILHVCPFLVSLELRNSFSFLENSGTDPEQMLALNRKVSQHEANRKYEESARYNITPSDSLILPPCILRDGVRTYNSHMKFLILILPTINVVEMDYLMSFISCSQLEKFELRLTRDTISDWIERDVITTLEFARYLCQVSNLHFEVSNLTTTINIESLGPTLARKSKLVRDFVHILKGDRRLKNLRTEINIYNKQKPANTFVNFGFNIKHQDLKFEYAIAYQDFINEESVNVKSDFLVLFDSFWRCAGKNVLDLDVSHGNPTPIIRYIINRFKDLDAVYISCRRLCLQERRYSIECNRKNRDITLQFNYMNINRDDSHFKHWASTLPYVTFIVLDLCNIPIRKEKNRKLLKKLLCSESPFENDHFMLDVDMFEFLEELSLTLPPLKPGTTRGHIMFHNEYMQGGKSKDIKFRRSPNIPKNQMVSITEDKDLNTTYIPVATVDRRLVCIKSLKAISISIIANNDTGNEIEIEFG